MKRENGITMISLIITIIIMLILAGVAISMAVGDESVVEQSTVATETTKAADIQEVIDLAITNNKASEYNNNYGAKNKSDIVASLLVDGKITQAEADDLNAGADTLQVGDAIVDFSKINSSLPEGVPTEYITVTTEAELRSVLTQSSTGTIGVILGNDITVSSGTSITNTNSIILNLSGYTLTNPVVGNGAIINEGKLTLKNGSIVNGVNTTNGSSTIINNGTLAIESGTYGTDDTAGAAVLNYGIVTINGGTFASRQETSKGAGACAYVFINQSGTMTLNNVSVDCETHGIFACYNGEIKVNSGNYVLQGNGGLGCYVVYSAATGKVTFNGGTVNAIEPRNGRIFFVSNNGNHFNSAAVTVGNIVINGGTISLNGVVQNY